MSNPGLLAALKFAKTRAKAQEQFKTINAPALPNQFDLQSISNCDNLTSPLFNSAVESESIDQDISKTSIAASSHRKSVMSILRGFHRLDLGAKQTADSSMAQSSNEKQNQEGLLLISMSKDNLTSSDDEIHQKSDSDESLIDEDAVIVDYDISENEGKLKPLSFLQL